jgi:transcriptional regulator with XRE-family HTH domain
MATKKRKSPTTRKEQAAKAPPASFTLGLWMQRLQISDEDLADKIGVRRETVWRWQTGERQPTKGMIPKIAKALGIEPADLYRNTTHISLDAAAAHITDPKDRERLARFLKDHPPS